MNDSVLEQSIGEFTDIIRAGGTTNLEDFISRFDDEDQSEACGHFVVAGLRAALGRGDQCPWLDRFLGMALWQHRIAVCRVLTEELFEADDGDFAKLLGIHEFGDYRATELIGFGGFGSVFRGQSINPSPSTGRATS